MLSSQQIATRVFVVAALPFVLGALYSVGRTLWFQLLAERAAGTVVELSGQPPSLVVEYPTRDGRRLLTESAGSDLYIDVPVGRRITVYYDRAEPSDARVDHFVEHWVVPLFLGIPALALLLGLLWVRRRRPWDPTRPGRSPVAIPFATIGVALLLLAAYLRHLDHQLLAGGATALGTVVDFRETQVRRSPTGMRNRAFSHDTVIEPVITFSAADGTAVRFVGLAGSFPAGLKTGDQLEVRYLSGEPRTAEIKGSQRLSGGAAVVAILGSVSLAVGAGLLLSARRRRDASHASPRQRR
jgi:hypothetical protein